MAIPVAAPCSRRDKTRHRRDLDDDRGDDDGAPAEVV
jgi:hypothetical protein